MKPTLYEKLSNFIEKHFLIIVLFLLIIAIVTPVLVWVFYSVCPTRIYTAISADGILAYCGAVISSIIALSIACISIYQSKKLHELDTDFRIYERKKEIYPSLQIKINKFSDYFEIQITNNSTSPATQLYLFEYVLYPILKSNETIKKKFRVGGDSANFLIVDNSYCPINKSGYPEILNLIFYDVDNHLISLDFQWNNDNMYTPQKPIYIS